MKTELIKGKRIVSKIAALSLALILIIGMLSACGGGGNSVSGGSSSSSEAITQISSFTSIDLNGHEVTEEVFADADVTMINFWGTYCGPCISEMPELATLCDAYENRAQLIGVPIDVNFDDPESDEFKSALEILETAGAKFANIKVDGGLLEYAKTMQYVPTSIFVDSEGNIVGGPVIGANVKEYKSIIEEQLQK